MYGYRSDIAAAFYAADKKDFPVEAVVDGELPCRYIPRQHSMVYRGLIVQESHTKWYDNYPEAAAFDEAAFKFRCFVLTSTQTTWQRCV